MPVYDYSCPQCGTFEKRAGYGDRTVGCKCGEVATRQFSGGQSIVMAGQEALPSDPTELQNEYFKEVRKRGWNEDRAFTEMRANVVEDKQGRKFLNTEGMTKEA